MRRRVYFIVVVQCGLYVALGINVQAQSREDESAIRKAIHTMTEAFNTRNDADTESVATADCDFVTVSGNWTKGPKAYTAARRKRFATALKNASLVPVDTKIRFLRSDVALAHVAHEIRGMLDESGKELPPHRELNLRVFVKEGGLWLMAAFHNTAIAAPVAPEHK